MGTANSKEQKLNNEDFEEFKKNQEKENKKRMEDLDKKKQRLNEIEKQEKKQSEDSLKNIIQHINILKFEKLKKKDLIVLLGNTGSGKSIIINFLLGSKLEKVQKNGCLEKIIQLKTNEVNFSKLVTILINLKQI